MRKRNYLMPGFRPMAERERARQDAWLSRELAPREQYDLADYQPLADWYRVQLVAKPETSAGGIYLPESVRENWTDAKVLAAGPGEPLTDGLRGTMWVDPGDRVLFMRHSLKSFEPATKQGMVRDRDLIAVGRQDAPDVPEPLNGWCLIEPAPPETHASTTIVWSEEDRPRPLHGRLLDIGPGEVRLKGRLAGTRKAVWEVWGLPDAQRAENLLQGAQVYWDRRCQALAIGRRALEYLLIQAGDLWAYAEE